MGFAAYVYDHKKQKPSEIVKNLYCQILNEDKKVVKEQLLLVSQGKANGIFKIDSLINPGNYSIRAFTNWMKNFDRPHFYESSFKVLNDNSEITTDFYELSSEFDIQITPEGGQLIENVLSTVVVSVRDNRGKYLKNVKVELINNNKVVKEIPIDNRGLGRFLLKPLKDVTYQLRMKASALVIEHSLPEVVNKGVGLTVKDSKDYLFIGLNTNYETLSIIKGQEYLVAINDNTDLKIYPKKLNNLENILRIDINDLNAGMNQVSLFTSDRKLLSQRLYFNYNGFVQNEVKNISLNRELDSLKTIISFDNLKKGNLSVSVHPTTTIALDKSQSITSSFKLNPFLNTNIKTVLHNIKEITPKKKYDIDNLLLCHGWVLYDWEDIFNSNRKFDHSFERGLTVTVNLNNKKFDTYFIYSNLNNSSSIVELNEGDKKFTYQEYYPMEDEKFTLSGMNKKGKVKTTSGFLEFYPSKIPDFEKGSKLNGFEFSELKTNESKVLEYQFKPFAKKAEALDTILLVARKLEERNKKIKDRAWGRVDIFDDKDRKNTFQPEMYFSRMGFNAQVNNGFLSISSISQRFDEPPVVTIDGAVYRDKGSISAVLYSLDFSVVDYIEIVPYGEWNPSGQTIKIVTNPALNPFKYRYDTSTAYDIPLTFKTPKKFFRPSYFSYTDSLFDKLGVIDWQGGLEVVDGKASFTMPYLGKNELLFHIQGWTEDGILIDEIRTVSVDSQ